MTSSPAAGDVTARRHWIAAAALVVGTITALRLALLTQDGTDLFVDEAQYWLWGQNLDWGYYSKPPLIGWTLRAVTELAGSDDAFWIRMPGALLHAAAALLLGAAAHEGVRQGIGAHPARPDAPGSARSSQGAADTAALWTAAAYATLPMVALGSLLISTDTVMAPFYALALWMWLRLCRTSALRDAAACGAAIGLAFMAKYAGGYFLAGAGLAALMVPALRVRWSRAALVLGVFAAVVAPNVAWNLGHDLATVSHTADNVQWVRDGAAFDPARGLGFVGSQFAVFGPVMFGALLIAAVRPGGALRRGLLWMSMPIVAAIALQAGLSRAYANWAVAAYFAGIVAVVPWLALRYPRWLRTSVAVNAAICVALPLSAVFPRLIGSADDPALSRYLGRADLSRAVLAAADAAGAATVVAGHRDILADLFHTGRAARQGLRAVPTAGRAPHYYAQTFPLTGADRGDVLWVARPGETRCGDSMLDPVARFDTSGGAYAGREIVAYLVTEACRDALDPAR